MLLCVLQSTFIVVDQSIVGYKYKFMSFQMRKQPQRGEFICPRSHSRGLKPGPDPGNSTLRALPAMVPPENMLFLSLLNRRPRYSFVHHFFLGVGYCVGCWKRKENLPYTLKMDHYYTTGSIFGWDKLKYQCTGDSKVTALCPGARGWLYIPRHSHQMFHERGFSQGSAGLIVIE